MRLWPNYLTGLEAVDVARVTGLPLSLSRWHVWETASLGADAAENAIRRGVVEPDEVILDVTRLGWWDRWRVTWTRIGITRWLASQLSQDELLAMVGE